MAMIYQRCVWCWMVAGSVLLGPSFAGAVAVTFNPVTQTKALGDPVVVEVVVSDLGSGGDPSLSTFDLDVTYDPSVLTATGVTFGGELGDGLFTSLQDVDLSSAGVVDFSELSFMGDFSSQPDSFTLATLAFNAIGLGTSALTFSQSLLGDASGFNLSHTTGSGSVMIEDRGMPPVPEPGTILLFGTGLAALAAWRMKKMHVR